jgi:hypothetical protein
VGKVQELERRSEWVTVEDWEQGYNWVVDFEAQLMNCLTGLVEEQQRLYRLIDNALNGTQYQVTGDDPLTLKPIITPEIPNVPSPDPAIAPGLRARIERLEHLLDNLANGRQYLTDIQNPDEEPLNDEISIRERVRLMQGTINAGWFGIGGEDATLADIVESLRVGNSQTKEGIWNRFYEILLASGSGANIADLLSGLFTDTVDAGLEGGILIMTIASMLANVSSQTDLAFKLQRIIDSLDGGGFEQPSDNVLKALRGDRDTPASAERNLASLSSDLLDRLRETDPAGDSVLKNVEDLLK